MLHKILLWNITKCFNWTKILPHFPWPTGISIWSSHQVVPSTSNQIFLDEGWQTFNWQEEHVIQCDQTKGWFLVTWWMILVIRHCWNVSHTKNIQAGPLIQRNTLNMRHGEGEGVMVVLPLLIQYTLYNMSTIALYLALPWMWRKIYLLCSQILCHKTFLSC